MNEFRKIYNKRFAKEEDNKEVESYSYYNNMKGNIYFLKELNEINQNEPQSIEYVNTEESVFGKKLETICSIEKNNKKIFKINPKAVYGPGGQSLTTQGNASTDTKDETHKKKKGQPKIKDSTEKKRRKHFPDNNRNKVVTSFMENVFNTAQKRCEIYNLTLNKHNVKEEQFGFNIIHYKNFINAKIYQILGYKD